MDISHKLLSLFIALDFLILTVSFFTLMIKLLPKVWLDEIAKLTAAIMMSAAVLKYFAA